VRLDGSKRDVTVTAGGRKEGFIASGCFEEVGEAGLIKVVSADHLDFGACDSFLADDTDPSWTVCKKVLLRDNKRSMDGKDITYGLDEVVPSGRMVPFSSA
jgi:hypothetical protein